MQFDYFRAFVALALTTLLSPSLAHIEYYDLNQGRQIRDLTAAGKTVAGNDIPLTQPSYWTSTYQTPMSSGETWTSLGGSFASGTWGYSVRVVTFDSASWTDGLRTNPQGGSFLLGDTHKLNFANFHLARDARVTLRVRDDLVGAGYGINPSLTLYRGAAVYQAHDDAVVDPLNPRTVVSPFDKIQNPKDTGSVVDSQGIASAYRNTLTNSGSYAGQFNALGSWSIANPAGDWSAVEYVASATGYVNPDGSWAGNANESSLLNYLLPAGDYIIAFGGNAQLPSYASARSGSAVSNLVATLSFEAQAVEGSRLSRLLQRLGPEVFHSIASSGTTAGPFGFDSSLMTASPVPEPSEWCLMLAGAVLLIGCRNRRARAKHRNAVPPRSSPSRIPK